MYVGMTLRRLQTKTLSAFFGHFCTKRTVGSFTCSSKTYFSVRIFVLNEEWSN